MDYHEYLHSEEWRLRRNKVISRYFGCQRCGSNERPCVHHKHYESVGNEKFSDVCLLCHHCHEEYHARFGKRPTPFTTDQFILEKNLEYVAGSADKILGTKPKKPKKPKTGKRVRESKKPKKVRKLEKSIAGEQRFHGKVTTRQATKEDLQRFGYSTTLK